MALNMEDRSAAEKDFIHWQTKHLTVEWAKKQLHKGLFEHGPALSTDAFPENERLFAEYALSKGWLSKRAFTLTASGFTQAVSMLKK